MACNGCLAGFLMWAKIIRKKCRVGLKFSPFLHLAVREISKSSKREGSNWMFSPFSDIEIVLTTILIFEGELNNHVQFSEV